MIKRFTRALSVFLAVAIASGCVPKDGPTGAAIVNQAEQTIVSSAVLPYTTVSLTPAIVDALRRRAHRRTGFSRLLHGGQLSPATVGPGDILAITIFESLPNGGGGGGLFTPTGSSSRSSSVLLPQQQVNSRGNIEIPYVGEVNAAGRSTQALGRDIAERLRRQAVEPQVVVQIVESKSNLISVLGEVYTPSRFSLDPGGLRLLEAVAKSGGSRFPPFETLVTIKRRGVIDTAMLSTVVNDEQSDIALAPGDTITLTRQPKVFLAFGATPAPGSIGGQNNRRFIFEQDELSLAEALAKAGGLDGARSDARSVFLYRFEPSSVMKDIVGQSETKSNRFVPVVYTLDLSSPGGFFLASTFWMRNRDLIFVSDNPSTDFVKFMGIIRSVTQPALDVTSAADRVGTTQ